MATRSGIRYSTATVHRCPVNAAVTITRDAHGQQERPSPAPLPGDGASRCAPGRSGTARPSAGTEQEAATNGAPLTKWSGSLSSSLVLRWCSMWMNANDLNEISGETKSIATRPKATLTQRWVLIEKCAASWSTVNSTKIAVALSSDRRRGRKSCRPALPRWRTRRPRGRRRRCRRWATRSPALPRPGQGARDARRWGRVARSLLTCPATYEPRLRHQWCRAQAGVRAAHAGQVRPGPRRAPRRRAPAPAAAPRAARRPDPWPGALAVPPPGGCAAARCCGAPPAPRLRLPALPVRRALPAAPGVPASSRRPATARAPSSVATKARARSRSPLIVSTSAISAYDVTGAPAAGELDDPASRAAPGRGSRGSRRHPAPAYRWRSGPSRGPGRPAARGPPAPHPGARAVETQPHSAWAPSGTSRGCRRTEVSTDRGTRRARGRRRRDRSSRRRRSAIR